jgi:predicted short-subunit dehydrogenase-like oxidoreductase (DUF2520 family)
MDLTFGIIGPGSVGSVLRHSLEEAGYVVAAVIRHGQPLDDLAESARAVAICTPDDTVARVAESLAQTTGSWSNHIAFHVSGALTSAALQPLAAQGAQTLSFHPLSSYPKGGAIRSLNGTTVVLEGMPDGVESMAAVARMLNASPVIISTEQKGAYHLAASMASNFLITLQAAVGDLLKRAELDPRLMEGLIRDTLDNASELTPEQALTGPIARGDVDTVRLHLETIQTLFPELLPMYQALARATANLAVESVKIDESVRDSIEQVLSPKSE